jgi:hypothetical protein
MNRLKVFCLKGFFFLAYKVWRAFMKGLHNFFANVKITNNVGATHRQGYDP